MSFARWDTRLGHVWVALSYRPLDTSLAVWRASARLAQAFGRERIFFDGYVRQDGDAVADGAMFAGAAPCVVLFIGAAWNGLAMLDPGDAPRREAEAALINPSSTLIPVLVDGADMPRADHLPRSLRPLAERTPLRLASGPDHDVQLERLVRAIQMRLVQAGAAAAFSSVASQAGR
jgi:hypothetical protein